MRAGDSSNTLSQPASKAETDDQPGTGGDGMEGQHGTLRYSTSAELSPAPRLRTIAPLGLLPLGPNAKPQP